MLSPVETVAQAVIIDHQRVAIEGCRCGWGHHPRDLGKSHAEHVIEQLRAHSLRIVQAPSRHARIPPLTREDQRR